MDKWKDSELNKMKAGGNAKASEFLKSQQDYRPSWSLQEKYNSRAAALLKDKVRQIFGTFFAYDILSYRYPREVSVKEKNNLAILHLRTSVHEPELRMIKVNKLRTNQVLESR